VFKLAVAVLSALAFLATADASTQRVFELRTYTCYEGKLQALEANFRDHTVRILRRHGIESVGYWVPQDPERSKDTLIFILAHPSTDAAKRNWESFRSDPEFKKMAAESQKDGDIVKRVESLFMSPTDFSALR
jgi:NIPSNAP protein